MKFEEYDFNIAECFTVYFEYGDSSGLTDQEIEQADNFLKDYKNSCFKWSDELHFARCDVTGLYADTLDVTILTPKKSIKK